ncbi:MAG: aminotransferase class I/II-fold pyridoxal phosphate-dependent enzyme [Rhodospirillaceae bacterium]|nr:aminotransferase class I/II-fold pyridoxal phosphate-dependent enzyme [Rhodospirillaceae bacterium]
MPHQTLQQFFDSPGANQAQFNLSASAAEPFGLDELLSLEPDAADRFRQVSLDYPARHGAADLKDQIAARYDGIDSGGVLLTSGLDDALGMLFLTLIEPGDRVVVLTPAYPPHLQLPAWRGAEVVEWAGRPEANWVPDLDELRRLIQKPTKMVITTFPQNPTGFMPDDAYAAELIEILAAKDTLLVADEIYQGLPMGAESGGANLASRYEHAISLHGLSKTSGMPGLRIGWMATQDREIVAEFIKTRDMFNAYLPAPIEFLANMALRHSDHILQRNSTIVESGLDLAEEFFKRRGNLFQWQRPTAGSLTFPRWLGPGSAKNSGAKALSDRLLSEAQLTLAPSTCFAAGDANFRVGAARRSLGPALARLDAFLSENFDD